MKTKFSTGFTLIEVIIAIMVIITAVVGVYNLFPVVVNSGAMAADRFVASQLASEGIELVRNIRDGNWLADIDWTSGLTNCPQTSPCEIDYNDPGLVVNDRFLQLKSDGFYNYGEGTNTKYKRKIIITQSAGHLNVRVTVSWFGIKSAFQTGSNSFEVQDNLYDWR
ncbi:MAG: prepilin-type N-terminal cleavage/methylation domain-containing protein [Patescibacteria group bacterium]|nr:prepilin-type N-terminal cleavage/methylation domain-containing protein [Patescibacteria group bacterium]